MPFVTSEDGVRLHFEVEGPEDGIPLVLLHGISSNLRRWHEFGYVDRLRDRFRLVLIDARGHGESDKPTAEEAYDVRARVLDVAAVMRAAGVVRAHMWGYSMGGHTAASAAIYAPQLFRSLVIGGASPFGARDRGITVPFEEFWEQMKGNPFADRAAWSAAFAHAGRFGGTVQALRTTRLPFLLYAGTLDAGPHRGLAEFVEKHGARSFTLAGKDHRTAFREAAAEVVPLITAFIDEVEGESPSVV